MIESPVSCILHSKLLSQGMAALTTLWTHPVEPPLDLSLDPHLDPHLVLPLDQPQTNAWTRSWTSPLNRPAMRRLPEAGNCAEILGEGQSSEVGCLRRKQLETPWVAPTGCCLGPQRVEAWGLGQQGTKFQL